MDKRLNEAFATLIKRHLRSDPKRESFTEHRLLGRNDIDGVEVGEWIITVRPL